MSQRATLSRGEMARAVSQPRRSAPSGTNGKVGEQQKELWQTINQIVTERAGAVVTPMFVSPIRIEVAPDSELPAWLRARGFDPIFCEQTTRIGGAPPTQRDGRGRPLPASGYGFLVVDVYQISLFNK